jgi:hypothetical protein
MRYDCGQLIFQHELNVFTLGGFHPLLVAELLVYLE